jgi:hypothetical protein
MYKVAMEVPFDTRLEGESQLLDLMDRNNVWKYG